MRVGLLKLWDILKESIRLDVFYLACEFSSEEINILSMPPANLPRRGALVRLGIFFYHWLQSARDLFLKRPGAPEGAVAFFALSKNELDCMRPVYNLTDVACDIGWRRECHDAPAKFWAYTLSCFYAPLVVASYFRAGKYARMSFAYVLDHFLLSYGLYVVARLWFGRVKPRALVLSNQLEMHHRVMLQAAHDENIATFFLQHASLSESTPPVPCDYALLHGQAAFERFAPNNSSRTTVFLIGMPKLDPYVRNLEQHKGMRAIAVCTNGLDPMDRSEELVIAIRRDFPEIPLIIRPHNADPRIPEWKDMARRHGTDYSDSNVEVSFDVFDRVDAIIAGDSNILLEAALVEVVPLFYDFGLSDLDWYGFLRHGMVDYLSKPEEVTGVIRRLLQDRPSVRTKAKLFCSTVGTEFHGRSAELASKLIAELSTNGQAQPRGWRRLPIRDIPVFEPSESLEPSEI